MSTPSPEHAAFVQLLQPVFEAIGDRPLDGSLTSRLNAGFGADSALFAAIAETCEDGIRAGWMGLAGDDSRKGGRVIEPCSETHGMSVDVVELCDLTGPHHRHPHGEICAVIPVTEGARFDGNGEGWAVYPPGSAHYPSGENGRVRIMFFLPEGAIEYTDTDASLGSGS